MPRETSDSAGAEQRLDEVIASYLRAQASGESPERQEWLTRYPEFVEQLSEFFADRERMDRMVGRASESREDRSKFAPGDPRLAETYETGQGSAETTVGPTQQPRRSPDRYVVKNFLARGGMGEVWLAEDRQIGRPVALKKLLGRRAEQKERFLVEAQITGQLEHPSIVPLHDLGVDAEGDQYYVMKYVVGRTLKEVIQRYHAPDTPQTAPPELEQLRLLEVFVALCHAVAFAHSRGVLHRDLKPDNIMIGQFGETLVLDWGLAKLIDEPEQFDSRSYVRLSSTSGSSATQEGSIMGSPAYMAPEVAEGRMSEVDQTTDVYLLGATLYEILTGRPPRAGSSALEMLDLARNVAPALPRKLKPTVSAALEAICLKAMTHDQHDRYQTAGELAEDIQCYLAGEPVSAYRENTVERVWRWCKRHRRLIKRSVAVVAVTSIAILLLSVYRENRIYQTREQAQVQVADFRHLADQTRYYATSSDPPAEHAPYFDLQTAETLGQAALELAEAWGPGLERLPLLDQRNVLRYELYDLLLLMVQVHLRATPATNTVDDLIKQLDRAADLYEPTQSYYRLRAECLELLGKGAEREREQAVDPRKMTTALDHFLLGEQYRTAAAGKRDSSEDAWAWGIDRDQLSQALVEYRTALDMQPDHYWSRLQLGRCLLSLDRSAEAVEAFGACVALRSDSPWSYSARGLAIALSPPDPGETLSERFHRARADLNHAIDAHPGFRPARLNRGVTYWLEKKYDDALADFDAVLRPPASDELIEAAYYRGQVYLEQGNYREALKDFDLVASGRPEFRPVYRARAEIHFIGSSDQLAIRDLNRFLQLRANGPFEADVWQACHDRGRFLLHLTAKLPATADERKLVLLGLAEAELQGAVERGGRSPALFDDLGAVLQLHAELDADNALVHIQKALSAYSDGLELSRAAPQLLIKRGWVHQALQRHDLALTDFASATNSIADAAEAHAALGYVHALDKSDFDASQDAVRALLYGGGDYLVLHNVACIYAELSRIDAARKGKYQDLAMDLLRRAVELWQRGGSGQPNELEFIKNEAAFSETMRARDDFQELIDQSL